MISYFFICTRVHINIDNNFVNLPRIIKNSGLYIELRDECNTTSNDHEGTADKANSAN